MKRLFFLLPALLLTGAAFAAQGRTDAIERLLNSRASTSPRTYAKAVSAVAEAARKGDVLSQYVIAILCDTSDWPASARLNDKTQARYLAKTEPRLRKMAEKDGDAFAWYLLYLGTRDESYLKKAVEGGNVQALNAMGTKRLTAALADPATTTSFIQETCFIYFKKAADLGDANGLNNLGLCYQNGWGCAVDLKTAFACFSKAAQQGHAEAINNLGCFHREGLYVKQDYVAALRCFKVSAGQGNTSGQLNYALAVLRGEGIRANPEKGIELLESLAGRGQLEAMDCLSAIYLRGVGGVEPSARKSTLWMLRARAARGDKPAAAWLKEYNENTYGR